MSTTGQAEENRARLKRDGYPEDAVWACEGFWFRRDRSWVVLGHRALPGVTAVLDARLVRHLAAQLTRLADDLEAPEGAEAKLAEVRETVETFLAHYGHSELLSFKVALDLAHGIQQVLDREPLKRSEEE